MVKFAYIILPLLVAIAVIIMDVDDQKNNAMHVDNNLNNNNNNNNNNIIASSTKQINTKYKVDPNKIEEWYQYLISKAGNKFSAILYSLAETLARYDELGRIIANKSIKINNTNLTTKHTYNKNISKIIGAETMYQNIQLNPIIHGDDDEFNPNRHQKMIPNFSATEQIKLHLSTAHFDHNLSYDPHCNVTLSAPYVILFILYIF